MPNEIDIAGLREVERKATPGPWEWLPPDSEINCDWLGVAHGRFLADGDYGYPAFEDDKALLVAVRNALPALLDEIERLRAYQHAGDAASREHPQQGDSECQVNALCVITTEQAAMSIQKP